LDAISLAIGRLRMSGSSVGENRERSSFGTAFFWKHNDASFAITNFHNLSGLNPLTLDRIGSFIPTKIELEARVVANDQSPPMVRSRLATFAIELEEGVSWKAHPTAGTDLAAVPISVGEMLPFELQHLNDCDLENDWQPWIGDDCFICGFPEGIKGPDGTPIWKRASIATQPTLSWNDQPMLLVDTTGNPGLSGSPVIARGSGVLKQQPSEKRSGSNVIGTWYSVLGVYSGRLSKEGVESQLGRVSKAELIDEMLQMFSP
jgi:hypothetical protein